MTDIRSQRPSGRPAVCGYTVGSSFGNSFDGGDGYDIVDYSGSGTAINATLYDASTTSTVGLDTLNDIEKVKGTDYANSFTIEGQITAKSGLGNDTFSIDLNGDTQNDMHAAGQAGFYLDGGGDLQDTPLDASEDFGDILELTNSTGTAQTLDFTQIDDGYIRGVETINMDNAQNDTVTLNFQDVFDMTDGDNRLIVDMDTNDLVKFDLDGGNVTKSDGVTAADEGVPDNLASINGTDNYHSYVLKSGGNEITLLIENQGAIPGNHVDFINP